MGVVGVTRGGARLRSGPQADPHSGRSEKRKIGDNLKPLLNREFYGRPPAFPLEEPTEQELSMWRRIWKYPQAREWKADPWRWPTIALYVRSYVDATKPGAPASARNGITRMATEIGLTKDGLVLNGWKLVEDEPVPAAVVSLPVQKTVAPDNTAGEGSKNDAQSGGRPRRLRG